MSKNNKAGYQLLNVIKEIIENYMSNTVPTGRVYLRLKKLAPLTFENVENGVVVKGKMLTTPKYRVFKEEEVGSNFLFLKMDDANKYVYLYEAAPEGENGERYIDQAEIMETYDGAGGAVTGGKIKRDGGGW